MTERSKTDKIIVHGSYSRKEHDLTVSDLYQWHVVEKEWPTIGYHIMINQQGMIFILNPLQEYCYHTIGENHRSIGICIAGGWAEGNEWVDNYSIRQKHNLKAVCGLLRDIYPEAEVMGHRDAQADRECPGFDVKAWYSLD